jgi:hypothetical protein
MGFIWENGKIISFMAKGSFILKMGRIIKGLLSKVMRLVKGGIFIIMAVFIKAELKIIKHLGMGHIMIHFKAISMKDIGYKTYLLDKQSKNSQTAHTTKDNLKTD